MTIAKTIGYGIGGFTLSLAMVVLTAASLQFVLSSIWTAPQSLLVAFGSALAICIAAIASSWVCLLKGLRNKAMVRGVWCQIYAFVGIACVGLLVALLW
jgi:hypothetical protein